jgi:hypothetical protein
MNRKMVLILPLLLLTQAILAIDPPGIMWTRVYYEGENSGFYHVIEAADGGFVLAGYQQDAWGQPSENCLFKTDANGNLLWNTGLGWYHQSAKWIEQLDDGGFIAVGSGKLSATSSYSLFMVRTDAEGTILWIQNYDIPSSTEDGYCIQPLPDGGFAVCSRRTVEGMGNQAWLLRTDAEGDTLWTREWGWTSVDRAMRVLYVAGGLTVLMHGSTQYTTGGPHLVRYNMDGDLLWETPINELAGEYAEDMCYCPWDGGYGIVTSGTISRSLAHVDGQGNFLWRVFAGSDGYSISTTMDGDYIYGGQKYTSTPGFHPTGSHIETDSEWRGHVALFGQAGGKLWEDWIYELNCMSIHSIRQLSQGGYIAAGIALISSPDNCAQLVRYAPETGIAESPAPQGDGSLAVPIPNPSTWGFSISFSLPTDGPANLAVYDLAGRRVTELYSGTATTGEHRVVWNTSDLPAGCYIVMLRTDEGVESRNCVLIR